MFLKMKIPGKSGISGTPLPCAFTSLGCGPVPLLSVTPRQCSLQRLGYNKKPVRQKVVPKKVESFKRHQSVYDKKCTIPSGSRKTHDCPWPKIRTWPTRAQQPAGSLFVSMSKPGCTSSPGFWLLMDIWAGTEVSSCIFARQTSHNSSRV